MVRVRVPAIAQLKILAKRKNKTMVEFQEELISFYRRKNKIYR